MTCGNLFSLSHTAGTESAPELKKALSCESHQFYQNTFKGTNLIFAQLPRYIAQILKMSVIGVTVVKVHRDTSEEPADNQKQSEMKLFPGERHEVTT